MNPQSDTEFIGQMAQFSSLEQAKATQTNLAQLQASTLLGKTVVVQVDQDTTAQGTVSGVQIEAGTPKLIVNGQKYDLSQVVTISPDLATNSTALQNYARISQLGR
jgi:flagellar basal-body rod modification protein FlgD